jgi:hypothetical protein
MSVDAEPFEGEVLRIDQRRPRAGEESTGPAGTSPAMYPTRRAPNRGRAESRGRRRGPGSKWCLTGPVRGVTRQPGPPDDETITARSRRHPRMGRDTGPGRIQWSTWSSAAAWSWSAWSIPFDATGLCTDARVKEPARRPLGGAIIDWTAGSPVPFVSAYVGLLPAPRRRTAPPVNPMRNTKIHRTAAWPMGTRLGGAVMRRSRRTSCPQHCSSNRDRPAVRGGGRGHAPSSAGAKRSLGGTGCRGTAYTVVAAPVKHRSQNLGYPTSGTANAIGRTLLRTGAIGSGRSGCPPSRRPGAGRWPKLGSRGQRREASRWPLRRRSPSRAATWRLPRG